MTERTGVDQWLVWSLFAGLTLTAGSVLGADPGGPDSWSIDRHPAVEAVGGARAPDATLILDDGSREADIGFGSTAALQFLWFNRFARPTPTLAFDLQEIQVLFPPGPEMAVGNAIQLVVYVDSDDDGDLNTGVQLVSAFNDTIQSVDGTTFSVYTVNPPVRVAAPGDILVGVVNRFVTSGVSPPSRPAALDTTTSQVRSWVAQWTGDPPASPNLPPDFLFGTIDFLEPGNWMIRAVGEDVPIVPPPPVTTTPVAAPTLSGIGLVLLASLVALLGAVFLRRRAAI